MKKLASAVFVFFTLTLLAPVVVNAEPQTGSIVISFERALQMSLDDMLAISDLDVLIREMRMQHRDLEYQLRRLESGAFRREIFAEFHSTLALIDMGLASAEARQASSEQAINTALGIAVQGLTGGSTEQASGGLRAALGGMAGQLGAGMEAEELRRQRTLLMERMREFDEDYFRDLTDEVRRGVREIERQIDNVELAQDIISTSLEYALRGIVVVISELESSLDILERSMELADESLVRARLSYQLGMLSSHEMLAIELSTSQGHTGLNELRRAKESVIQNLNLLINQPFDQNTVIDFELYVPEMPEDLNAHIEELIRQSPSILQLHNASLSARAERRAFTGHNRDITISESDRRRAMEAAVNNERVIDIRTRIALQEAVERSDIAYDQAVRSMEFALRQAFNELAALNLQLETAYRELALAESTLNISLASLSVGRITQFEADQAELAVASARQNIESIYSQLWILAFGLRNPEVL